MAEKNINVVQIPSFGEALINKRESLTHKKFIDFFSPLLNHAQPSRSIYRCFFKAFVTIPNRTSFENINPYLSL